MENFSLFAAEYGFIAKLCAVALIVVVAGLVIRKRMPARHPETE